MPPLQWPVIAPPRTSKVSVRGKRKKAAWNDRYMLQLLTE
jgi:hypothetical protein